MSVEVDYFYSDDALQDSEFQEWWFGPLGAADGRYWSCAVVPEYANVAVLEVTRFWWSSDNTHEFNITAHFVVRADYDGHPGGVNFGFKAIRAPSV